MYTCPNMSIRMRHTRAHTRNRRSHHNVDAPRLSDCTKCGEKHMRHRVCENCGTYKGKEFIDVLAKLTKKERKIREKELASKEEESTSGGPLDPAKLSDKQ